MITSNQTHVLFEEISRYIDKHHIGSLLDIGAGEGTLAKALSEKVDEYTAVESNKERAKNLKSQHLEVIEGVFPFSIDRKFDMVLSSHSIPEEEYLYKPFLEATWHSLNHGGILLIVTFKGGRGELVNVMRKCDDNKNITALDEKLYNTMRETLNSFGEVKVSRSMSKFESRDIEEVVELVLASINSEKSRKESCANYVKDLLQKKYFLNNKFFFPYEHVFVSIVKK